MRLKAAYFGHHKCASSWIDTILSEACKEMGLVHGRFAKPDHFPLGLEEQIQTKGLEVLSYTNAEYFLLEDLPEVPSIHVVRDPRDVIVSGYFSHKSSHPHFQWEELAPHRDKLNHLSLDEGLFEEFDFSSKYLNEMAGWNYERNNTLQIKMEDLTHDPFQGFLTVFDHFGFLDESVVSFPMRILRAQLPFHNRIATKLRCRGVCIRKGCITAEALLGILYRNSFKVLAGGRSPGQTNEKSHYRKGVAGDWRNYFGPKHIDVFKERFGDLLIQLGYETDTSWS